MGKIILGLDLGITSIGWALVRVDDKNSLNSQILDSGVRIFTIAEHPKDGKSLALPRREARSARRTTKRKSQKLRAIKRLLLQHKIITQDELNTLFIGKNAQKKDVWDLRREALYRELDNKELSRIMIHLAKHRGYSSNRKSEEPTDSEGKAVLSGIGHNNEILKKSTYQTVGEYISTKKKKRNGKDSEGKLNYENSVSRAMLENEIKIIFSKQKEFGNSVVNDKFLESYKTIAFEQRPLKSVAKMVANCPFEVDEKRASQSSYTFEYFRALQKLKNLRVINEDGYEMPLIFEQIEQIIYKAKTIKPTAKFTYKSFKKLLPQYKEMKIKGLVYHDHKTGEVKDPEGIKFLDFSAFAKMKKALETADNLYWQSIENDSDILDNIAKILTTEKDDKESIKQLKEIVKNEKVCEALVAISFSGFGHLSNKALKKIIPILEEGYDYDKACEKVGYDFKTIFKGNKTLLLPALSEQENLEMTNPVVKRAIAQMRLVYNAIARKHGELDAIHIEFTRDIKKSHDDRRKIEKAQEEFRETKENARMDATDKLGHEPNAKELLKFRLWEEQKHHCIYSGKYINPDILCDPFATEVDHILPYSRSMDDSLNNKVLCFTKENQGKGSQTPFEYMGSDENSSKWLQFVGRVNDLDKRKQAKKDRLLKTNFDENSENSFKDRNKKDTSYISKFVKNYMEAHIAFKESKDKRHVFTMNGMLTTQLRFKWGVGDKNRENHLHHAEDAIILAFSTQSMVQKLSTVSHKREGFIYKTKEEKAKKLQFETPLEDFGKKVKESVNAIFVSHMPRRKVGGAAHKETVYSKRIKSKGVVEVNGGVAEKGEVKRIDIFEQDGKFHFVYLYPIDFIQEKLKSVTIKNQNIDENYNFKFSIFKNDLIEFQLKDKLVFGYLNFAESDGRFNVLAHDKSILDKKRDRHSTGSMKYIKKYQVNPLGNYVEVKNEKRQGSIKESRAKRKK